MQHDMKLKMKDLSWLGQLFADKGLASPLKDGSLSQFEDADRKRLRNQGTLDDKDNLHPAGYAMLSVLAQPKRVLDISLMRGPLKARQQIYLGEEEAVSTAYEQEEALLSMPPRTERLRELVRGYFGSTQVTGCDLKADLEEAEALVFLALADHYRFDSFRAMADEEAFVYAGVKVDALVGLCNEIRENSQSLRYHLFVLSAGLAAVGEEEVERALASLLQKGLIKREEQWIRPAGDGMLFCGGFLVLENVLSLAMVEESSGELYRSFGLAIQSGPIDVVYLEKSKNGIFIECVSSDEVIRLLDEMMHDPVSIV